MKCLGFRSELGALTLIIAVASVPLLCPSKAIATDIPGDRNGASYLATSTDSNGNFRARFVLSLHAGHTMSVVDSNSGGPDAFFTTELGSWKPEGSYAAVGSTIDFDFPPNADVARIDYTINFQNDGHHIVGTQTVTTFPLEGNPLDGGGTKLGTFNFTGELITP